MNKNWKVLISCLTWLTNRRLYIHTETAYFSFRFKLEKYRFKYWYKWITFSCSKCYVLKWIIVKMHFTFKKSNNSFKKPGNLKITKERPYLVHIKIIINIRNWSYSSQILFKNKVNLLIAYKTHVQMKWRSFKVKTWRNI